MNTDAKAVARWDIGTDGLSDEVKALWHYKGRYVLFTDHDRVVGELEERLVNMKNWAKHDREMIEVLETEIETIRTALASSRAEVEGLRKDAERYRWLRDHAGKDDDQVEIFIEQESYARGHLDAQVDAAMEKGNV